MTGPGTPTSRIALIATPRSGSTWLRRLLASSLALDELTHFAPADVPWSALPARVLLQIHWRPTDELVRRLDDGGFKVVTLARHPLDVLLSILRFSGSEPSTARWLDGEAGDERAIAGVHPTSDAFLAYATGPRARALLEVSGRWWGQAPHRVRYEALVTDTAGEFSRLLGEMGLDVPAGLEPIVAAQSFTGLRDATHALSDHFWQGRPGLWRSVLPAECALRIAAAHLEHLSTLGYGCEPDSALDPRAAELRWLNLEAAWARRALSSARGQLRWAHAMLEERERALLEAQEALGRLTGSRSWRLTAPLRVLAGAARAAQERVAWRGERRNGSLLPREPPRAS